MTYVDCEVVDKQERSAYGLPVVTVQSTMTTQEGGTILIGTEEVSLPM